MAILQDKPHFDRRLDVGWGIGISPAQLQQNFSQVFAVDIAKKQEILPFKLMFFIKVAKCPE